MTTEPAVLAGLRGAFWDADRVPHDVTLSMHLMHTQDGKIVTGNLLSRGDERVVTVLAHPREHLIATYLAAEVLNQGHAVFVQAPRSTGNDIRLEHEIAVFDLAAAVTYLRSLGFLTIIALGSSGGGALWALYNQQALAAPDQRIARTPGGRPTNLARADLIPPDGVIFVGAHLGQGTLLLHGIDPSVEREDDPFSTVADLDPFSAANGYAPGGAAYSSEFIVTYREAQRRRVERIDEIARGHVAERGEARSNIKAGIGTPRDEVRSRYEAIFTVWRTDADLRSWDQGIDPSDRRRGSLWGSDPIASNYGSVAFGRVCTAASWLSTWSGLSTNASMEKCGPSLEQPTLMVEYTSDAATFPADYDRAYECIGSPNKSRLALKADHHGRRLSDDDPDPRLLLGAHIGDWIGEHFSGSR